MKHTKFMPPEFAKGLGERSVSSYEKTNRKMIKEWVKSLSLRGCVVTEDALRRSLICWLHGRDCGTRDDAFNFYMESKFDRNRLIIEVWPLRDRQDDRSYIGE